MTVLRTDLKIFKPERLGNEPFSGGYRTSDEVISGKLNEVFRSISDIDHARSAFDLVKLYPTVNTADNSHLQDAYVYISEQPTDPLVSTLLIENDNLSDGDLLSDMQLLLASPSTKFHGLALATSDVTSDTIDVDKTTVKLVPNINKKTSNYNLKGYEFNGSESRSAIRTVSFTAPDGVNVNTLTLSVDDFIDENISWEDNRADRKWYISYLSTAGQRNGYSFDLDWQSQVSFSNGSFEINLLEPLRGGSTLTIVYKSNKDYRLHKFAVSDTLALTNDEFIVKGSFRLKKAGTNEIYTDNGEGLFIDNSDNVFAQINYETGDVTPAIAVDFTSTVGEDLGCAIFMLTAENRTYPSRISFRMSLQNQGVVSLESVYLRITLSDDSQFSVSSSVAGSLIHANVSSGIVKDDGYVFLEMASNINVKRIDYDFDEIKNSAAQADWYGFDATQLRNNGNVNIFHINNVISIANSQRTNKATLASAEVVSVLADADFIDIMDSTGASLYSPTNDNYSYDKVTGDITMAAGVGNFTEPFVITAVQSERALVSGMIGHQLQLLTPLSRSYPTGSSVSSVFLLGDLQAASKDERTSSYWADDFDVNKDGNAGNASGNINTTQYPIELSNAGAIKQKWAIVFTSSTAFKVIGNTVGIIYQGDISVDLAPTNHRVAAPFFIIRKQAFGAGLDPGEAFLFETTAGSKPIMLSRAVSPGHTNIVNDQSTLAFFGNSD